MRRAPARSAPFGAGGGRIRDVRAYNVRVPHVPMVGRLGFLDPHTSQRTSKTLHKIHISLNISI